MHENSDFKKAMFFISGGMQHDFWFRFLAQFSVKTLKTVLVWPWVWHIYIPSGYD